jgi:hypothetical protein
MSNQILAQNDSEWNSYVNSLLNATTSNTGNEMLALDRLLLNFAADDRRGEMVLPPGAR